MVNLTYGDVLKRRKYRVQHYALQKATLTLKRDYCQTNTKPQMLSQ